MSPTSANGNGNWVSDAVYGGVAAEGVAAREQHQAIITGEIYPVREIYEE